MDQEESVAKCCGPPINGAILSEDQVLVVGLGRDSGLAVVVQGGTMISQAEVAGSRFLAGRKTPVDGSDVVRVRVGSGKDSNEFVVQRTVKYETRLICKGAVNPNADEKTEVG